MELFKPGKTIDFMQYRNKAVGASVVVCVAAAAAIFYPGLNYGIDFSGGTELQVHFGGDVSSQELRQELTDLGYESPDVIAVQAQPNTYIIRVRETTTLPEGVTQATIQQHLDEALPVDVENVAISQGGDNVIVRLSEDTEAASIATALTSAGLQLRGEVRRRGAVEEHRYEAALIGLADQMVQQLDERLAERGPETPDRVEWVGPRAGEQLRFAALRALLYSILFIMIYVAFRFDLRFAPGGIVALAHDALFTVGVFIISQREFNLTIVAALLTVIGYSMNDTIVVFDRIRENLGRHRDKSLHDLINISITETLGRTIITSGVTMLSIAAFFVWGTQAVRDISFTLEVGFLVGTYSSIYIAAPVTEWMDDYLRKQREKRIAQLKAQGATRREPGRPRPAGA